MIVLPTAPPTRTPSRAPTKAPTTAAVTSVNTKATPMLTLAPTRQSTRAPTAPLVSVFTSSPTKQIFKPTAAEWASTNYRIDYAQTTSSWDSGYYYYDGTSRYGSYWFIYDEAFAQSLDAATELHYLYRFEYQPMGASGRTITVHFAPEGCSASASGVYHHHDTTGSKRGYYKVFENGRDVEKGRYFYTRIPGKAGGYGGYLSEATFYYTFFPSAAVSSGRLWPNYRRDLDELESNKEGLLVETEDDGGVVRSEKEDRPAGSETEDRLAKYSKDPLEPLRRRRRAAARAA